MERKGKRREGGDVRYCVGEYWGIGIQGLRRLSRKIDVGRGRSEVGERGERKFGICKIVQLSKLGRCSNIDNRFDRVDIMKSFSSS
jgi:hypothetical protein